MIWNKHDWKGYLLDKVGLLHRPLTRHFASNRERYGFTAWKTAAEKAKATAARVAVIVRRCVKSRGRGMFGLLSDAISATRPAPYVPGTQEVPDVGREERWSNVGLPDLGGSASDPLMDRLAELGFEFCAEFCAER
jgi:hypothetical protein